MRVKVRVRVRVRVRTLLVFVMQDVVPEIAEVFEDVCLDDPLRHELSHLVQLVLTGLW